MTHFVIIITKKTEYELKVSLSYNKSFKIPKSGHNSYGAQVCTYAMIVSRWGLCREVKLSYYRSRQSIWCRRLTLQSPQHHFVAVLGRQCQLDRCRALGWCIRGALWHRAQRGLLENARAFETLLGGCLLGLGLKLVFRFTV